MKDASVFRAVKVMRILLLGVAAVFLVSGLLSGDVRRMYIKAVFVCMECIGLG